MSSIPLVATQLQPVQIPDMIGNYEKILRIRNLLQNAPLQQQALQQQVQQGQLDIQEKQMSNQVAQQSQQDQQVFRTTMQDPSMQGKTIGDVADTLARQGKLSQAGWTNLKKADLEQKTALAGYDDTQLKNAAAAHQQTQTLYNNVMNLPDDVLAQQWPTIAQQYDSIPGNNKLPLDPNQPMSKAQLKQFGPMISMQEGYLANETAKRESAAKAKTAENAAMYPTGDAAEAKYRSILQKKAAGQPLSADDVNYARGYEASNAKTSTTSDSLGVSGVSTSRPAGLSAAGGAGAPSLAPAGGSVAAATVPSAKDSIVDLIGQYRYDPAQLTRLVGKHPDILSLVQQKYPGFDETTYQAKNKLVQNYTSGPQSREINAYNTTMGHLSVLDSAVSALNNNDVRALNSIGNAIGAGTGNDAQTVFRAIVHRVGPEITSAYITGGGGEAERVASENDFNENLAPGQLRTNIRTSAQLLDSKVEALEQQYSNTVGRDDFAQRFITPHAQAARDRLIGGNGGGNNANGGNSAPPAGYVRIQASDGSLHDLPQSNLGRARQRDPGLKVVNR